MKVQIRRIRPEGMELDESFPVDFSESTQIDILKFTSPFHVRANITRADDEVLAKITVKNSYESFCNRCLEAIQKDWVTEFMLTFDTKECKEFIEMDEDIRQELILNLPVHILCQADLPFFLGRGGFGNSRACRVKAGYKKYQ